MAEPAREGTSDRSARARWVFLGICGLLSIVLVGSMLTNYLGARRLGGTVIRGQAGMVFHLLHRYAPPGPPAPRQAEIDRAFRAGESLGLQYFGIVGPRGHIIVEAGEPRRTVDLNTMPTHGEFEWFGDVVRVWSPKEPRVDGKALDFGPPPEGEGPPPEGKGPPRGHRPPRRGGRPRFVIEFVPTQANAMVERAHLDLYVGLGSVIALWMGAFAFWKLSQRTASAEAELARKRHLATLGEMSAVIAHEIRNPLASLKGNAQLLREQVSDPKALRKANRVVDDAVRLQALTKGLLDFVRSGRVQTTTVSVGELVREAVAGSVAAVDVDLERAPQDWSLDRSRMRQVLVNLLDNAHHAAPEQSVALTVRADRDELVLEVADRGPGVPERDRTAIFEPFNTGRTQGTGLGLAVCRRIVGEHGGSVVCSDNPRGGALFTVRIP